MGGQAIGQKDGKGRVGGVWFRVTVMVDGGVEEKAREELKIKEENTHQAAQLVQQEAAPSGSLFCLSSFLWK